MTSTTEAHVPKGGRLSQALQRSFSGRIAEFKHHSGLENHMV